jgi:hypothetical protein
VPLNDDDIKALAKLHPVFLRWGPRLFRPEDFDFDEQCWVKVSTGVRKSEALCSKWFLLEHSAEDYCSDLGLISLAFIPESDNARKKRSALVSSGAPLVRWRRLPPVDSEQQKLDLDKRVQATAGTSLDLLVCELGRREGESLFWDDAGRTFDPEQLTEISTVESNLTS